MKFYRRTDVILIPSKGIKDGLSVTKLEVPFEYAYHQSDDKYSLYFNLERIGWWEYARYHASILPRQAIHVITFGFISDFPLGRLKHRGNCGKVFDGVQKLGSKMEEPQ